MKHKYEYLCNNYEIVNLVNNMISLDRLLQMNRYERGRYLFYRAAKLNKRLDPEYEEFIKIDPEYAYLYARDIIKGRWFEAEKYIKKNPQYAYLYAKDVIKGRWLEAELYILKDPMWTYWYIYDVIKGRWFEAEEIIMKNPQLVYLYSIDIMKHRWYKAEQFIKKDNYWWGKYRDYFRIDYDFNG